MKTLKYIILLYLLLTAIAEKIIAQENMLSAIDVGSKFQSFSYTDTKNTTQFANDYQGQSSNDVFYKFTLTQAMEIRISHCGSELFDTFVHLLDANGNVIDENDDDFEYEYCENPYNSYIFIESLPPGTYFVVSEGYDEDGNITTTIEGIKPLPPTGLYDGSAVTSPANSGQNYILSITPTVAISDVSGLGVNESLQTVQYFDGLGRPIQTVQRGITPTKQDLATFTEYDGAGREQFQWLPIPTNGNGAFSPKSNFTSGSSLYSTEGRPYNEMLNEPSPLNRILGKKGPGQAWENKPTTISYETNVTADQIACYYVNTTNNLARGDNYSQSSLYKTVSKDEDGKTLEEYKDKLGQVILKRSKDGGQNVDTYFVNNDLGQLAYVIPPLAADGLTATGVIYDNNDLLEKYGYLYKYDERGNCKEKRLPGCEPIYMVYDRADRIVLSQDGNQRAKTPKEWIVTKYDVFGRVIFTGITAALSSSTHNNLITTYKDELIVETYVDGAYSINKFADATPLTINYYDDYIFRNNFPEPTKTKLNFISLSSYNEQYTSAKGLLTGTHTYYLDGSGNNSTTAMYYDYRGRVVQTRSTNHLGGYDITYNQYNFGGQVTQSLKEHSISETLNTPLTELYVNDYDHAGRLLKTKYKLNDKPQVILNDMTEVGAYDEMGRLRKKKRHNGTDNEEYDYNIRNWTTRLKSGAFEETLHYNSNPVGTPVCYNGNISYSTWKYDNQLKGYAYFYDNLNRLSNAQYTLDNTVVVGYDDFYPNEEYYNYDKMGNIKYMWRNGVNETIDYLFLKYNGNQLMNIHDYSGSRNQYNLKEYHNKLSSGYNSNTIEMAYDANGNLIKDLDRDIVTIKYNLLNLPEIIQFKNGNQIRNLYDAGGQKLNTREVTVINYTVQPIIAENTIYDVTQSDEIYVGGTDYIGNIEYNYYSDYYNGQLLEDSYNFNRIYNSEGYVNNTYLPNYNYYRRDHLGNNREVWKAAYSVNGSSYPATTIQRTQYYPSGLPWASNSGDNPSAQNKKYNGKEFVEMHGLDETQLDWRTLYNAIMRTPTQDPHCENYYDISPYAWCGNNPINRIDPNGMDTIDVNSPEDVKKDDIIVTENGQNYTASTDEVTVTAQKKEKIETKDNEENYDKEITALSSITLLAIAEPTPLGEIIVLGYGSYLAWKHGPEIIGTAVDLTKETIDKFAHTPKKQSTGKSGSDRHAAQYRHGGKNRPKNPNQRKDAEVRKNKGKTND